MASPDLQRFPGMSPAGAKWQRSLLTQLDHIPVLHVASVGHVPEPAWPRGRAYMPRIGLSSPWPAAGLAYVNLPAIRILYLVVSYLNFTLRQASYPDIVVSYNSYWYNLVAAIVARSRRGSTWVAVIADVEDSIFGRWAVRLTERIADGCVYLSYELATTSRAKRTLHFEGGVEPRARIARRSPTESDRPSICYAGALSGSAGIFSLVEAVMGIDEQQLVLDIYGHGDVKPIRRVISSDARIRVHGLVDPAQLEHAMERAAVLVNPRQVAGHFARTTFPSKLLDYLRYGVPVVSTISPGLSPEYRDVVIPANSDRPEDIRAAIEIALSLEASRYEDYVAKVEQLVSRRSWPIVGREFACFLERCYFDSSSD